MGRYSLPDVREELAQCDKRGKMHDMCGVHYLDQIVRGVKEIRLCAMS